MTLLVYKVIGALLIFLVSLATIIYPLRRKSLFKHAESVGIGEAFASGIFLGAAFFHMLPDAITLFAHQYPTVHYPVPEAFCVLGFLCLLFLERLSFSWPSQPDSIPYILAIILVIHALIEGAALGMGATLPETFMLLVAILAHKGSESFALCITMLRHQLPLKRIIFIMLCFAVMTPLGIGFGALLGWFMFAPSGELVAALFNAFAAGTFLYMSTLHHAHFHKHTHETQGTLEFACLVCGLSVMAIIALWT